MKEHERARELLKDWRNLEFSSDDANGLPDEYHAKHYRLDQETRAFLDKPDVSQLAMQDAQAANRDLLLKLATTLERVADLETYKAHHKTCLELAEEVNRDITLERRINASLREKCDQQQLALQRLADALRKSEIAMQSAWYELQPGSAKIGDQFIRQDDMEKIFKQARATLEAAKPFLPKEKP